MQQLELLRSKIKSEIAKPRMSSFYYGGYKQALIEVENMIMDMLASTQQNTYGSKGSNETNGNNVEKVPNVISPFLEGYEQINQNNPVTRGSTALVPISSQTEISDAGKDTADYIDRHIIESMKELAREGFKPQASEISDEEIEKASENAWSDYEYEEGNLYSTTFKGGWKLAIKWYREQLKSKL